MNRKIFSLCFVAFFVAVNMFAQKETESAEYPRLTKLPVLSTDFFYYGKSDFEANGLQGEIDMQEWSTVLQYVIPLKEKKWYFSNRLQYTLFNYNTQLEGIDDISKEFHSIAYTAGITKVLPKRWSVTLNLSPTLATDFEESLSSDDLILQFSALAMKRSSPYFSYGFGLAYTTRFGSPTVLPLLSLTYKKNNFTTLAILPAYIAQYYSFNEDKYRMGLKVATFGNLYNAELDQIGANLDLNRVSYSRITFGPDFRAKLFNDFYLNLGGGMAFRNILEFQDSDLNTAFDFDTDNKFFFNVGIKLLK
ncbi:DUF6268 family outer membrane beta-barrel protein [Aquimarina sediminis]|uniref:DUF6268 family outer membrane beta-barrel protein n=1 Tax=Aquimarina sediminis TaxID=2070536 RepID=UPI000CA05E64|nr:DUF6268 family outer membrane beta-barrel protein [Aquimarina sediminis]